MSKNPINVALVGFGFSGSTFHAPFLSALEDYNWCCVMSSNSEKVKASLPNVRVESDFTKVLKDPALDLIVIATPNATHYRIKSNRDRWIPMAFALPTSHTK